VTHNKPLLLIVALLFLGVAPAHAKTIYHCAYQGVTRMVMTKYVKDGNNIIEVGSGFVFKILDDNESGLVFALGHTVIGGFHYSVSFINKKDMSYTKHYRRNLDFIGQDGEQYKQTGQCRRE